MRWLGMNRWLKTSILIGVVCITQPAESMICPELVTQCLDLNPHKELIRAGAKDWEIEAIDAITRGMITLTSGLSKNHYDILPNGRMGFAHFGGSDPLRVGLSSNDIYQTYGVLYGEHSFKIQLSRWRKIIQGVSAMASRCGCRNRRSALASIANTMGASGLRGLLGQCAKAQGNVCDCAIRVYSGSSDHRARRIQWGGWL